MSLVNILQTSIESRQNKNGEDNKNNSSNKTTYYKQVIHFLICHSCFWCASYSRLDVSFVKCPSCSDDKLEWMPISDDEVCKFDYDNKNDGIVLEFSPKSRERIR